MNKPIIPVGVFVNKPLYELIEIIKNLKLTYVQLHGSESSEYITNLKKKHGFDLQFLFSLCTTSAVGVILLIIPQCFFFFFFVIPFQMGVILVMTLYN